MDRKRLGFLGIFDFSSPLSTNLSPHNVQAPDFWDPRLPGYPNNPVFGVALSVTRIPTEGDPSGYLTILFASAPSGNYVWTFTLTGGEFMWDNNFIVGPRPSSSQNSISFGTGLAADGNILAVSDPGLSTVYLFQIIGSNQRHFIPLRTIEPPSNALNPVHFGDSLAMKGDILVIVETDTGLQYLASLVSNLRIF